MENEKPRTLLQERNTLRGGRRITRDSLSHVSKDINITVVARQIFLFDQPFELLLDHLFRG